MIMVILGGELLKILIFFVLWYVEMEVLILYVVVYLKKW